VGQFRREVPTAYWVAAGRWRPSFRKPPTAFGSPPITTTGWGVDARGVRGEARTAHRLACHLPPNGCGVCERECRYDAQDPEDKDRLACRRHTNHRARLLLTVGHSGGRRGLPPVELVVAQGDDDERYDDRRGAGAACARFQPLRVRGPR